MTFPRVSRLGTAALLLAATLGFAGCGGSPTYGYFTVEVNIDPGVGPDFLERINSCAVLVDGARETSADLACARGTVKSFRLGTFDYSTSASGSVRFTVLLKGLNDVTLARGETGQLKIVPNDTVMASVLVNAVPGAIPDGGF